MQAEFAKAVARGKEPYMTGLTSAWILEVPVRSRAGASKLHLLVGGSHENLLTAVGKMVEVLSATEHDSFSPSRDDASSRGNFPHFPNPLEVTLKIDSTNAGIGLQRALSRDAVG